MGENKLVIKTRCTITTIDYNRCEPAQERTLNPKCGFACIKADRMYDRNILRIDNYRPVLAADPEVIARQSNESLSWEYACRAVGRNAIETIVEYPGLEEYRKRNC